MLVLLTIYILSVLFLAFHLFYEKRQLTRFRVVELALLYQLIFCVGLASFLAFIGFLFFPEIVAQTLGWNTCPFQHEMANASLGYAVLGFLAIWIRGHFWTAIVIGRSIWLLGDALGHIYHIVVFHNTTEGNAGLPLYSDVFVPVILLLLLSLYLKWRNEWSGRSSR